MQSQGTFESLINLAFFGLQSKRLVGALEGAIARLEFYTKDSRVGPTSQSCSDATPIKPRYELMFLRWNSATEADPVMTSLQLKESQLIDLTTRHRTITYSTLVLAMMAYLCFRSWSADLTLMWLPLQNEGHAMLTTTVCANTIEACTGEVTCRSRNRRHERTRCRVRPYPTR